MSADPLPPRLREIARHVLAGHPMADIGTDHALLPAALVATGIVPSAVAIDNKPGPLRRARDAIAAVGGSAVQVRAGDGLEPLANGEVATVVLAGLGGPKIAALADAWAPLTRLPRLIVQPNTAWAAVRRWVAERRFTLVDETMVRGGSRFYLTLVIEPCVRTEHPWARDDDALHMGPILRHTRPKAWHAWIEAEHARLGGALHRARTAGASTLSALERTVARFDRHRL